MPNNIERMTLAQQIAQAITIQISEGRLKPGHRLLENELTNQYNTSRAPIREALYILEKDGIVERKPRRGVFVKALTKKELVDLYDTVYRLLEIALLKGIEITSIERMLILNEIVEEMEETIEGNNIKKCLELLDKLQIEIFRLSNNEILTELYITLNKRLAPYRYISLSHPTSLRASVGEYRKLLIGFRERNIDKIRKTLIQKEKRALSILERVVEDNSSQ